MRFLLLLFFQSQIIDHRGWGKPFLEFLYFGGTHFSYGQHLYIQEMNTQTTAFETLPDNL